MHKSWVDDLPALCLIEMHLLEPASGVPLSSYQSSAHNPKFLIKHYLLCEHVRQTNRQSDGLILRWSYNQSLQVGNASADGLA